MENYRQKARTQLGTVGSGNHYVDLMRDEEDMVWIGVHFGSRGLGHASATRYLKAAGGKDGMNVPPAIIDETQSSVAATSPPCSSLVVFPRPAGNG
jgi:tRNA-splicing ligase RtcB